MKKQAIGIIDSGIGGFSVAKAIQTQLPTEDILYLGDGANAPYGNRTATELTALASYMVNFMNQQEVKLLLIACNTISCLSHTYHHYIQSPVLYVAESGAKAIAHSPYERIGVISTNFTHQKALYAQHIQKITPDKQVFSQGSTNLVKLIEENKGDAISSQRIQEELKTVLAPLLKEKIQCCVLGCTHYPLAKKELSLCFPDLPFSDPAEEMALEAQVLLAEKKQQNTEGGSLTVYTTGDVSPQEAHLQRANLQAKEILHLPPLVLS